jgi:hypothetical protein
MSADATTLAYLAGIIDSDGYITVHRSVRNGRVYHGAVIGISGTRREPHDLAASVWGGNVRCHVPPVERYRPQFQWGRTGDGALVPIMDVLPYLRVKERQAWIALDLQEHVMAGRGSDPYPWLPADYDPLPYRENARAEVVAALAGRELDGRTWHQYPA